MGFLDEMKDILKHTADIKTLEENIKEYGVNANTKHKYFISIDYSYHYKEYHIHYNYLYFGSNEYNELLKKYDMKMEYIDGSIIGIKEN